MPLVTNAAELFREIKRHGLELRDGNGRDDALYAALAVRLRLTADRIQEGLNQGHVSVEQFVSAFFGLVHPFAQMYADVYSAMQKFGARRSAESIRLQFDFGKQLEEQLTFDLNKFREFEQVLRKIRGLVNEQIWRLEDLNKVFTFYRRLGNTPPNVQFRQSYSPGRPFPLPEIPPTAPTLGPILENLRTAYQKIIDARVELEQRPTDATWLSNLGTLTNEANVNDKAIREAANLLTDLMPNFLSLLSRALDPKFEELIGEENVTNAARYFRDEIESQLQSRQQPAEVQVKALLDVLRLPMWRFRWYLYEVWSTFEVLNALEEYDINLALEGDQLKLEEGRAKVVAEIDLAGGKSLQLWAQKQTPIKVKGRKGIQPDLRLCEPDGARPDQTLMVIEFKQRKQMSRSELEELVDLYDVGAPQSLGNFFLNYDSLPQADGLKFNRPEKAFLFEFLNPQHPNRVTAFRHQLVALLKTAGIRPVRAAPDVLLLDVSGSMTALYSEASVRAGLERLGKLYPDVPVYYFDDRLIAPAGHAPWQEIDCHLHRGTNLEVALQELTQREPNAVRLLLVTDGDFGSAPSLKKYEVTQLDPRNLVTMIQELIRPCAR